jgi:hypothetical protein
MEMPETKNLPDNPGNNVSDQPQQSLPTQETLPFQPNKPLEEYVSIGVHANNLRLVCSGAKHGEPYTTDQCFICWVAKNYPDFSYLDVYHEIQPDLSRNYYMFIEQRKKILEHFRSVQKNKDDIPIWKKAVNFAKSAGNWLASGAKFVPDEIKAKRLFICQNCSLFTKQGTCSHLSCGCQMNAKVSMASESCPIGKWVNYDEIPKFDEKTTIDEWYSELKKPREYAYFRINGEYYINLPECKLAHNKILLEAKERALRSQPSELETGKLSIILCHSPEESPETFLKSIREELKCNLPIEYWYVGDFNIDDNLRSLLSKYNAVLYNALDYIDRNNRRVLSDKFLPYFALLHSPSQYNVYVGPQYLPGPKFVDFINSTLLHEAPIQAWEADPSEIEVDTCCFGRCGNILNSVFCDKNNDSYPVLNTNVLIFDKGHADVYTILSILDEIANHDDFYQTVDYSPFGGIHLNSRLLTNLISAFEITSQQSDTSSLKLLKIYKGHDNNSLKDDFGRLIFSRNENYALNPILLYLYYDKAPSILSKYAGHYIFQENNLYEIDLQRPHYYQRMMFLAADGIVTDKMWKSDGGVSRWSIINTSPVRLILFDTNYGGKERIYAILEEKVPNKVFVGKCFKHDNYLSQLIVSLEKYSR